MKLFSTPDGRKRVLFLCGVFMLFFTSMSKVLVPGTMFSELQHELNISAAMLGMMGSGYMYCYAASQLALGLLSTRYGGVRILLFGTVIFTVGSFMFPFLDSPDMMIFSRCLTGLGAGTVFIGLAKIIDDLFPDQFGMVLGIVLFIAYFGPVTGGLPMVAFIRSCGWRTAMVMVGIASAAATVLIIVCSVGNVRPTSQGQTFRPLWDILRSRSSVMLFFTSSLLYGTYYTILTIMGKKALEDFGNYTPYAASFIITVLSVIVACNNVVGNVVLKLLGGRHKLMVLFSGAANLGGTVLLVCSFGLEWDPFWVTAAYILIAIPAGFFSIFGAVVKELNPPEYTGLAVAVLNFLAFVAIAVFGNLAGLILASYETPGSGAPVIYPAAAYRDVFLWFLIPAVIGMVTAFFVPETYVKGRKA